MPFEVTMPKLSPTMEEGTIVKWHKKEGDQVQSGDVLMEIATDKATVEYNALDEGWLRKILVQEGQEAAINDPIAIFSVDQQESLEGYQPRQPDSKKQKEVKNEESSIAAPEKGIEEETPKKKGKEKAVFTQPEFIPEAPLENYHFEYPSDQLKNRILASPLAKKIAKEKKLDLSGIKGTGPNQRIMSRDLVNAPPLSDWMNPSRQEAPTLPPGTYEEQSLSPMRKVISQRLQESKSFIPHFYVTQIIDADPLVMIRDQLKNLDVKISINDFIIKACAITLRQFPAINSGFNSVNQTIIQFKTIDIAVAVSIDAGLITPIIRHADYKNLRELSLEMRSLALRARESKLNPSEYKGGSFTISNLGMYGVTEFQAIINPPQAAILAVSGIQEVPVIRNQTIVPGKTIHLTLSVDHRVIDGVAAALFLQALKKILENPSILLLG